MQTHEHALRTGVPATVLASARDPRACLMRLRAAPPHAIDAVDADLFVAVVAPAGRGLVVLAVLLAIAGRVGKACAKLQQGHDGKTCDRRECGK